MTQIRLIARQKGVVDWYPINGKVFIAIPISHLNRLGTVSVS